MAEKGSLLAHEWGCMHDLEMMLEMILDLLITSRP